MTLNTNKLTGLIDYALSRLIYVIAPKACPVCGRRLAIGENAICSTCLAHTPRTHQQFSPYDNTMARLLWGRIPVERAVALFYFEPKSEMAQTIYSFKYHNHKENAEYMGRIAAKEIYNSGFFDGIDYIVPVPLARKRMRQRGYNQSYELAKGIRGITNIPIAKGVVKRKHFVESQTHKSFQERFENVENAFEATDTQLIEGKHILIVDDVMTTGATIIACAKAITKHCNVKISVFTLGITLD